MHYSPVNALKDLEKSGKLFQEIFQHGSLSLEIYKPDKVDLQEPHRRDEVYFIISGSGSFINGNSRVSFRQGDFLFVPAGVFHRFEDFTEDFSAWVIFYGPDGGEKENS